MIRYAAVFPGQGSQRVGMGRDFFQALPGAREELFERADAILRLPLTRLCLEGPEEELARTENTQPALFLVGFAAWRAVRRALPQSPVAVAGHSLGEYTALCAAGAFSFEDGLRLVRRRGELMADVGQRGGARGAGPGGMAAILNLPSRVEHLCREAAQGQVLEVANYNAIDQTVVTGEEEAVQRAIALAKEWGGRAIRLRVSAPFHCSLMSGLAGDMARALAATSIRAPGIPVIANVTAEVVSAPGEVRQVLTRQVAGPVRWTETLLRLRGMGAAALVECGPGRVLAGLAGRAQPPLAAFAAEDMASAAAAARAVMERGA